VDVANARWVFKKSEAKMKRKVRVNYLGDQALSITKRQMVENPTGPLFRNSRGRPWTTLAVNCHFKRIRMRIGMEEAQRQVNAPNASEVAAMLKRISRTRIERGKTITKSEAQRLTEARRKLRYRKAASLGPRYSLYALRHSWATNALEQGIDALTVAVLMGHSDPSTLARVYQHLSHNPKHLLEQAKKAAGG